MSNLTRALGLVLSVILLAACSSTTMSGSWSDPAYKEQVKNVYVIGVSKNETTRRIFEDTFVRQLSSQGVKSVSSYVGLPNSQEVNRADIIKKMKVEECDSVLLTKLVSTRSESVTTAGRISGYSSGHPYYGKRGGHYNSWDRYYSRRNEVIYTPPTTTDFVILTIESVLYDLQTEEMIWSGQLETVVEGDIEKMIQDFVNEVSKDLAAKGII